MGFLFFGSLSTPVLFCWKYTAESTNSHIWINGNSTVKFCDNIELECNISLNDTDSTENALCSWYIADFAASSGYCSDDNDTTTFVSSLNSSKLTIPSSCLADSTINTNISFVCSVEYESVISNSTIFNVFREDSVIFDVEVANGFNAYQVSSLAHYICWCMWFAN